MTLKLREASGATPLLPEELPGLTARHISGRGEPNELEGETIIGG